MSISYRNRKKNQTEKENLPIKVSPFLAQKKAAQIVSNAKYIFSKLNSQEEFDEVKHQMHPTLVRCIQEMFDLQNKDNDEIVLS